MKNAHEAIRLLSAAARVAITRAGLARSGAGGGFRLTLPSGSTQTAGLTRREESPHLSVRRNSQPLRSPELRFTRWRTASGWIRPSGRAHAGRIPIMMGSTCFLEARTCK